MKSTPNISPQFADDTRNAYYLSCAIVITVVESVGVLFAVPVLILLGLHLIIAAALTALVYVSYKKKHDLRFPVILWIAAVIFGPCGCLGFFCTLIVYSIGKRFSTPFEKWYASLFPVFELSPAGKIYERIVAGWDDYKTQREVISFQDLMQVGSVEQRQTALEIIALNFNPLLAPILKQALDDPSNQIRVQAASIVAKIDAAFEQKKIFLLHAVETHPENLDHLLELANHLDSYAFAGILDVIREKEYRELAISYYKYYLEKRPDDHQAWMALGRMLNRLNAFDQVEAWFEEKLKQETTIPATSYVWYWEALYMLRDFNKLTESAQKAYREMLKSHPQKNLLDCVELWANQEG